MIYQVNPTNKKGELLCQLCSKPTKNLVNHVRVHNLTGAEYRSKYGLHPTKSLISKKLKKRLSDKAKVRETNFENFKKRISFAKGNTYAKNNAYLKEVQQKRMQNKWVVKKYMEEYVAASSIERIVIRLILQKKGYDLNKIGFDKWQDPVFLARKTT